jgi:hypothetical protein
MGDTTISPERLAELERKVTRLEQPRDIRAEIAELPSLRQLGEMQEQRRVARAKAAQELGERRRAARELLAPEFEKHQRELRRIAAAQLAAEVARAREIERLRVEHDAVMGRLSELERQVAA